MNGNPLDRENMKALEDLKSLLGLTRATKSSIVKGLLKKGHINPYEASILLEGQLIVHIDSVEITASSGGRIVAGDDLLN